MRPFHLKPRLIVCFCLNSYLQIGQFDCRSELKRFFQPFLFHFSNQSPLYFHHHWRPVLQIKALLACTKICLSANFYMLISILTMTLLSSATIGASSPPAAMFCSSAVIFNPSLLLLFGPSYIKENFYVLLLSPSVFLIKIYLYLLQCSNI